VLGDRLSAVPDATGALGQPYNGRTYRDIWYEESQAVGYLHFDFYNGAMSTDQCQRLRAALLRVRKRPTKVIVLMGGTDFWSNGIHLNVIEAAADPAHESWRNIHAINDLVRDIITTDSHLVMAAMQGNAAAGGVMLALAADLVCARKGIVLNPHYKGMGRLYGSEYWTYLLPKRVGATKACELTEAVLPISTRTAHQIGLIDDAFAEDAASFRQYISQLAEELACSPRYARLLEEKRRSRQIDEDRKPLQAYREEELQQMWRNFFGADQSYHLARQRFVYKGSCLLLPSSWPTAVKRTRRRKVMTQPFPRFCPQCGSPREAGQRFCPTCGTPLDMAANNPTARASDQQSTLASPSAPDEPPLAPALLAADGSASRVPNTGPIIPQAPLLASSPTPVLDTSAPTYSAGPGGQLSVPNTGVPNIPPPPPPASLFASPETALPYSTPPTPGTYTVPPYARAPKRSQAGLVFIALLLVLVLGGVGGYLVFFRGRGSNTTSQQGTAGSGSTTRSNTSATGGPTTEPLNLQFTYASEAITLTSVQEAASFADDLQPHQGQELVRITLNETNPTRYHAGFGLFSDVAHLLLPDGSTAIVNAVKLDGGLDANASRTNNWLDFAISSAIADLSKLVLRIGTPTQHQMDIPLMPHADLSQYQDKTITPNTIVSYGGLDWTLQSVALSLSGAKGMQAMAGMRYVIFSLRVENPTSHAVAIGFPQDYLRLKSTEATSAPLADTTTLPLTIDASTTNVTGTVFFLMPQNDTAFTLEWLVSTNPVYDPVSNTQVNTDVQFI
jgi:enoyl-CoA hydratase/carnithine racemase